MKTCGIIFVILFFIYLLYKVFIYIGFLLDVYQQDGMKGVISAIFAILFFKTGETLYNVIKIAVFILIIYCIIWVIGKIF